MKMAKFQCKDGNTMVVIHPEHALLVQGEDEDGNKEPVVLFEVGNAATENKGWKMKLSLERCQAELDIALNWKPPDVKIVKTGEAEGGGQ
jgi:hypothetical protein